MTREFRYPLTRICLRSGRLTLPLNMLELFPESGTVTAFDSRRGNRDSGGFELTIEGPRTIAGFGAFFVHNELEVNDEVVIRPLEDGRYALTGVRRPRKPDYGRREVVQALLDEIVEAETPLTVAEIRSLFPDIPADFALEEVLSHDDRLHRVEGRWRPIGTTPEPLEVPDEPEQPPPAEASAVSESSGAAETPPAPPVEARVAAEAPVAAEIPVAPAPAEIEIAADAAEEGAEGSENGLPGTAAASDDNQGRDSRRRVTVTPYPRGVMFPAEAALNSASEPGDLTLVQRAREALLRFGYRVASLSHGQLLAHAELGRYQYKVLVHVLPDRERIDWGVLMNRRREVAAKYLAVFGDHRDLQRLFAPADMARATLWSWAGVDRVLDLSRTVLISPIDLEPHFDRDGMFEQGLARFERSVGDRIRDRGAFSAVLSRLATLRAPAIFVLDDLTGEVDLTRDQLLKVIERLSEAPFHLVVRVGNGEFCLRNRVGEALLNFSEYALSLRDRLPLRNRERVVAHGEPGGVLIDDLADDALRRDGDG